MRKAAVALTFALLVAACGGGSSATTGPGASAQPSHGQTTTSQPVQAGEPIDATTIQAAVTALKAHDSWQFDVTTYQSGTPDFSQTVSGTQRTSPQKAVSATHNGPNTSDFNYIRIGDDIWYDVGTGTYTQTTAAAAPNLTVQYEPYYLDGLVQSAVGQDYEFDPVGTEQVSGITTTHYRLSEEDLQSIVENLDDITTAEWAGDVWIADADGSLLRLAWGPQTLEDTQLSIGFNYVITSLDCTCPVDPPTAVAS